MATRALGHEFWIAPVSYQIDADQPIKAQLRVGQKFEGAIQRFFPRQITRFEVFRDQVPSKVTARLGDDPALQMDSFGAGLLVVVHETADSVLTYHEADKFVDFVTHKGAPHLLAQHKARGLPPEGFNETYRRYAKSLIASGDGHGQDFRIGMRAEIVALANPYLDDLSQGLPVQVFYENAPKTDAFVEMFARQQDGVVLVSSYRTDAQGVVVLPVRSGVEYLIDAAMIYPLKNDDPAQGPVWESLWPSLTFLVPVR